MSKDIRVSTPEKVYDQLVEPQTTEIRVARKGLIKILNPAHPYTFEPGWFEISKALIETSSTELTEERDLLGISLRIVGLMRQYPWLQGFMHTAPKGSPISRLSLDQWAGNHVFDDLPGLFAITAHESHVFRAAFHGGNNPREVKKISRQLDIVD